MVDGKTFTAAASREIILSAGTIQTPQLLELSGTVNICVDILASAQRTVLGIGNSSVLQKVGIETLVDLPGVGENFQVN